MIRHVMIGPIRYFILLMVSIIFLGVLLISDSCMRQDALHKIKKTGKLRVITRNNAHCYYIYRDEALGFEYDLAKEFAKYLGVKAIILTPKWEEIDEVLEKDMGDMIAASMTITEARKKRMDFSMPYMKVQQMVIVHRDNHDIKDINDLNGKEIHIRKGTSYEERLQKLKKEGFDIHICFHRDIPTEELIKMVANKEIEITIADSNIAMLNRRYYPDVKIIFPIEKPQYLGWAVKKGETALLSEINSFFKEIRKGGIFDRIYQKYYANVEIFDYVDLKKYHQRLRTRLPRYKKIIQRATEKYGFDWRLIAAMIYQESHFDPNAVSFTGVKGLMQLTNKTAEELGIKNRSDPEQSIMGGVRYLARLYQSFKDAKNPDRMLITIASYNVGRGHILDAQELAKKKGLDPNSWAALQEVLPLLRYKTYYMKARYGYCRGTEPVRYVNRIITYYDILKRGAIT